jgi:hypothetical protein
MINNGFLLVVEQLNLTFLLLLICIIVVLIAIKSKFFQLNLKTHITNISFWNLIFGFAIYFLTGFLLSLFFAPLSKIFNEEVLENGFYLISTAIMIVLFFFFFLAIGWQKIKEIMGPFKLQSLVFGILTWLIAFPLSSLIGVIAQIFTQMIWQYSYHEQVAVSYLKKTMDEPLLFLFTILSFSIVAPFLEELIFRGLLQNFFKRFIHRHFAIVLSALVFAFFHFNVSQNYDNIELIISLFVLGWFLGFIYEKKNAILASFGLHMTFNMISIIRIILNTQ